MTTLSSFDAIVAGSKARFRLFIDREVDALGQHFAAENDLRESSVVLGRIRRNLS